LARWPIRLYAGLALTLLFVSIEPAACRIWRVGKLQAAVIGAHLGNRLRRLQRLSPQIQMALMPLLWPGDFSHCRANIGSAILLAIAAMVAAIIHPWSDGAAEKISRLEGSGVSYPASSSS